MEAQIDDNTRAILVNNPSNPCGSVYSKEHLLAIIDIAERHHIPIVAVSSPPSHMI
jgi:tyrosine aminotransferase